MKILNLLLILLVTSQLMNCTELRRKMIAMFGSADKYSAEGSPSNLKPVFLDIDQKRTQFKIKLTRVVSGLERPTDMVFVPGETGLLVVLSQKGTASLHDLKTNKKLTMFSLNVKTESEMGLLGLTFHPAFKQNRLIYVNYNPAGTSTSRISEFKLNSEYTLDKSHSERIIFSIEQPYPNHNAGDLEFGPDGYLYIGWGDGGWRDDIHGHGQNTRTLLGSIMRIDVNTPANGKEYTIPADNPFIGQKGVQPETWAYGFRNPWKISFYDDGRLIVADVGQNKYEEVTLVAAAENHGWNIKEGFHCFKPAEGCKEEGLVDPIFEYPHPVGASITGGYVYKGRRIPGLVGHYIVADFITGRMWALNMKEAIAKKGRAEPLALGKWPLLVSTLARDNQGEIYLADFAKGIVYRIDR